MNKLIAVPHLRIHFQSVEGLKTRSSAVAVIADRTAYAGKPSDWFQFPVYERLARAIRFDQWVEFMNAPTLYLLSHECQMSVTA